MRKLLKEGSRNVHHRIDSEIKAAEAAVVQGKAVGEAFHSFSGSTNQFGELCVLGIGARLISNLTPELGRVLQQLGEFIGQVEEVQQTLDTDLVRQVQVPLDAQVKELQKAKGARKNFEKARLDYDTAGTKVAMLFFFHHNYCTQRSPACEPQEVQEREPGEDPAGRAGGAAGKADDGGRWPTGGSESR